MASLTQTCTPVCVERPDLPYTFKNWRPAHHEILTVELTHTDERLVPLTGTLHATFIHALTGVELYRHVQEIGNTPLYAVASRLFPNKYYVVRESDYACSCYQSRLSGVCDHAETVREYVEMEVAA